MFKQRKSKGSLKQRKKEDSDSETERDSNEQSEGISLSNNAPSKKSHKSTKHKKKSGPVMSFLDGENIEDDGGDVAAFKVKKSKLSKTIKRKMHQAPIMSDRDEGGVTSAGAGFTSTSTSSLSSSGDYLDSLRAEQNFSAPLMQQEPQGGKLEGMELTGEEAESMEELTETLAEQQQQQPGGGGSSSNSNSSSQLPDYIPLHMDKRHAGTSSQGLREEARRGNEVGNGQHQQEEEQEQEDKDWEAQLAKRAGLRPLPASMTSSSSTRGTSQSVSEQHDYRRDSQSTPPPSSSRAETEKLLSMLSYETVKRTLRSQITSLSSRSELADSRLRSLESSLENHRSEADALREVADAKQAQMAFLQHLRLFASDVCGMLREKEELISQLQAAVLDHLTTQASRRFDHWKQRQDLTLEHMRQAGDISTLGGYLPEQHSHSPSTAFPSLTEECAETFAAERALQDTMHTFHQAADTLMQDVRPDLSSLPEVLKNFQDFRKDHFTKYTEAYISLSLSQILKHYILLDIVPLYLLDSNESDKFDISRRPWYTALFNFSLEDPDTFRDTGSGSGQNGSPRKNDSARGSRGDPTEDDSTLLPRVAAHIVLPWFTKVVEVSLNPLSVTQMTTCRQILEQLRVFDLQEEEVASLCLAVLHTTVKWLGSVCVPVIKVVHAGAQFFVRQQLDRLSLILENIHLFSGVIAASALAQVAWTTLVSQGRAAMIKLLAGNTQASVAASLAPHALPDNEVANYASASRLCRAVRALLPPQTSSTRVSVPAPVRYEELAIPAASVTQLAALVLSSGEAEAGVSVTSASLSNGISGSGSVGGCNPGGFSVVAFGFHKAALLKYLRQLPA